MQDGAPAAKLLISLHFFVVDATQRIAYNSLNEAQKTKGTCTMAKAATLFVVTDIETTLKKRIAFDVAWRIVDKKGREYESGSYVIRESFKHDVPFFKEKLGHYFDDAYAKLIRPASILEVRAEYNRQIRELQAKGHRVICCAYNAAFDFKYLPETLWTLTGDSSMRWLDNRVELLDIWDFWGESVPQAYGKATAASDSGKYVSTSAESAYRWEFCQEEFEERHIAWHDCLIESDILVKALSRKKPMPVVKSPSELAGAVWKKINTRLGIDGKSLLPQAVKREMELVGA